MSRTPTSTSPLQGWREKLDTALAGLAPRERLAVQLALWLLGLALLWWLALGPAWRTLSQAPERHARLDAQLDEVRQLAATASALREQASGQVIGRAAALRAIEVSMATLGGTGQMSVLGDRVSVTLSNTPPQSLAQWLAQVRLNARVVPVEAQLNAGTAPQAWSGTIQLGGMSLTEN
ncbi:MAG: type II secretion system protein M [Hydrogenophaga sp.]|jgi:general secretion pathway protein M|nr:type II secretion system protein M [Hydrogenophaga sp.]